MVILGFEIWFLMYMYGKILKCSFFYNVEAEIIIHVLARNIEPNETQTMSPHFAIVIHVNDNTHTAKQILYEKNEIS